MRGFVQSFVWAARGIAAGARGRNFRIMVAAAVAAGGLAVWLRIPRAEAALIALCMAVVLALELLNTAGEMLVDILSPDHDERYGRVKDVLAGAVLVAAIGTAVAGVLVLGPPLWARLTGP